MRARAALAVVAVMTGLGCVRDSGGPAPPSEPGEVVEVRLTADFRFVPADVTISPGTTVRWVNATNVFHTITPEGHMEWTRFPTSTLGESFEHTFESPGDFPYFCEPHRAVGMVGRVTVR